MTLPETPDDVDPWMAYDEEYAATLEALDSMNHAFMELEVFEDRALGHTDLDRSVFNRNRVKAGTLRDEARALLAAHATYVEQFPEGEEGSSPVSLDEVNDKVREMKEVLEAMRDEVEAYAAEQEDGQLWMPWISPEDQTKKLERAVEAADEVYEQTWELAPNPWPTS